MCILKTKNRFFLCVYVDWNLRLFTRVISVDELFLLSQFCIYLKRHAGCSLCPISFPLSLSGLFKIIILERERGKERERESMHCKCASGVGDWQRERDRVSSRLSTEHGPQNPMRGSNSWSQDHNLSQNHDLSWNQESAAGQPGWLSSLAPPSA